MGTKCRFCKNKISDNKKFCNQECYWDWKAKYSIGRTPTPRDARFWAKVKKEKSGCWIWQSKKGSSIINRGRMYGMLSVKEGEYLAHRISWEIHHGSISPNKCVLHRCDNRLCVNPKHLFLGTHEENMKDMVAKWRSIFGVKHPRAKLNEKKVVRIRRLYATGKFSQDHLAQRYGVTQPNIGFIVRRVVWKHV